MSTGQFFATRFCAFRSATFLHKITPQKTAGYIGVIRNENMLNKKCPWCNKKIPPYQLGSRPRKDTYKWFEVRRYHKVCPYCANPVKISGKGLWFFLLITPLGLLFPIYLLTGVKLAAAPFVSESLYGVAVIGILLGLIYSKYDKNV